MLGSEARLRNFATQGLSNFNLDDIKFGLQLLRNGETSPSRRNIFLRKDQRFSEAWFRPDSIHKNDSLREPYDRI